MLRRVEVSGCEAVLMLLIGDDAVEFNRAFSASGLDRDVLRFSSLIDENVLLASGADNTRGLMTSAGYFEDLATTSGLDFAAAYFRRFGPDAPVLNSLGESCYEGVRLLTELMRRARSVDVPADDVRGRRTLLREPARHRGTSRTGICGSGCSWPPPTACSGMSSSSSDCGAPGPCRSRSR